MGGCTTILHYKYCVWMCFCGMDALPIKDSMRDEAASLWLCLREPLAELWREYAALVMQAYTTCSTYVSVCVTINVNGEGTPDSVFTCIYVSYSSYYL